VICAALVTEEGEGVQNVTSALEFRRRASLCPLDGQNGTRSRWESAISTFCTSHTPPATLQ
jgi:hypothetical protein